MVVVGAGPAGATAALSVLTRAPTTRVLLLDRQDFPRDKCCGDGIASQAVDVLDALGARDVVAGWTPVRHLHLSHDQRRVEGRMARPTWVIPRAVFDANIVAHAIRAGATLLRHRVRTVRVDDAVGGVGGAGGVGDGHGRVVIDDTFSAKVVIGADGAQSVVGAQVGGPPRGRRAIALRGYAPTLPEVRGRQVIRYGVRQQPSYAWAFDRGDGWSNVGYGELADPSAGLTRTFFLDELERLIPGAAEGGTSWRAHHLPLSGWGWGREQPDGRILLVGDAAGLINPMTGEGIYYAVATGSAAGRAAAQALHEGLPERAGALHRAAVRALLNSHLRHTWTAARLSRSTRVIEAGIAAAARDHHAFDDLVEIGLGDGRITPRLAAGLVRGLVRRNG